jgi:SAM-dependent methyltransferase
LLNEEKVMDLRSHFDALFSRTYDPWNFSTSWYEQRKIILTLAALPRNTYRNAFELGCANGVLTAELAHRAVALLSCDICPHAVEITQRRTAHLPNVTVEVIAVPQQWPDQRFDLIVLSEFMCYPGQCEVRELASRVRNSLLVNASIIACHWRYAMEAWAMPADEVHRLMHSELGYPRIMRHEEEDLLLDIWTCDGRSVVRSEGVLSQ